MKEKVMEKKEYKKLIVVAYLCMIILGLTGTLKGAAIPSIRTEFGVEYAKIGQMLIIGILGSLGATFWGGMIVEKQGVKKVFIFGIAVVIMANVLFSVVPSFYGVVGIYFLLGIGVGSFQIAVNALGGQIFLKNAATMMNLMHLFYGVGSMIGPRYAAIFIGRGYSWKLSYLVSIILLLVLLFFVLSTRFPEPHVQVEGDQLSLKELIKSSKVWLIALVLGFFGIVEVGMGTWLVNYLQEARALDIVRSTSYLTGFYVTYTLGRLVGGYISDQIGYIKSLIYFTIIATSILFAGVLLGDTFLLLFSAMGFFVSITMPTMLALIMKEYRGAVGAVMGFVMTISGIFNMLASWIIGNINDYWNVGVGMIAMGISGAIACLLLIVLSKQVSSY